MWAWPTPRFQWVTWTLTSTTLSLWRRIAACHSSSVRQCHGPIDLHPPALWLLLCSTQVSAADMKLCICAAVMTDAICEAVKALDVEWCCRTEMDSQIISRLCSRISHIFHPKVTQIFSTLYPQTPPRLLRCDWLRGPPRACPFPGMYPPGQGSSSDPSAMNWPTARRCDTLVFCSFDVLLYIYHCTLYFL